MKRDQVTGFAILFALLMSFNAAADWSKWLGPQRDGTTSDAGFDPAFAKGGVDVKWSADIGIGFSAVTVADGKAYTAGWKDGKTTLYAFDAKTGDVAWSHTTPTGKYADYNIGGTRGSATVDGDKVYFINADGKMYCYNADDGSIDWEKNLAATYRVKPPTWGFSGTPVIIDDIVYVDVGRTLALNKTNGKEIWKTDNLGPAYSTPAPFTLKGNDYLAVFPKSGLHVLDRATGKKIAHQPWDTQYGVHAATPVVVDDKILISSEYNNGCALLEFDGKRLTMVWDNRNLRQKMGTSVYHDGVFYGFNSTQFACVDAKTGKTLWTQRGMGHGTIILAGETLIVLSDKGEVYTAKASRKGFEPIIKTRVIQGDNNVWTAPTLANSLLYVRGSRGKLVCIDVSK
jgi:outer membrane protein assembly factor BamB